MPTPRNICEDGDDAASQMVRSSLAEASWPLHANLAFGVRLDPASVYVEGISSITLPDLARTHIFDVATGTRLAA